MATSTGGRLDAIFAELNPINQEIRKIGWTPPDDSGTGSTPSRRPA